MVHMNKRDMILITVIVLLAALSYILLHHGDGDNVVSVYVKGSLHGTYDLSVPRQIHIVGDNGIINVDYSKTVKNEDCSLDTEYRNVTYNEKTGMFYDAWGTGEYTWQGSDMGGTY